MFSWNLDLRPLILINAAESIDKPFGVLGRAGARKYVLDVGHVPMEGASFGGKMGRCNAAYRENGVRRFLKLL